MAEPIGIASGLVALAAFAFKSTVALRNAIQGYEHHPKHVRELLEELASLAGVLTSLQDLKLLDDAADMSVLDMPLQRCGAACEEFRQELLRRTSRSGNSRKSFRDWISLKYMGEDIRGFRDLLSRYKSTIIIALNDANLRNSTATLQGIEEQKTLIRTVQDDLEARLLELNKRFDTIFGNTVTDSETDTADMQLLKEEQDTTQRCLDICAQLLAHIDQIRLTTNEDGRLFGYRAGRGNTPEDVVAEGLRECTDYLDATTEKLEAHMQSLIDRMFAKSQTTSTSETYQAEILTLRDEWQTARRCKMLCVRADKRLKEGISVIDNYATGDDAFQIMVSTDGNALHGRNRGLGRTARQVGGHLSDTSLQQLSRDMVSLGLRGGREGSRDHTYAPAPQGTPGDAEHDTGFHGRYGRGCTLDASKAGPKSSTGNTHC